MKIVGKTQDGKSVVAGIGRLYFETGIPLSVMFDVLRHKGYVIAWPELVHELEQNGMKRHNFTPSCNYSQTSIFISTMLRERKYFRKFTN